jgi:exopolysaccharide production protein ExoZ
LQILRAFAAIGVVIYHTDYRFVAGVHTDFLGVATFFVISGFIMCFITRNEADSFFVNRIVRIVPLYWLCTFACLAALYRQELLDPSFWGDHAALIIRSLFFLPSEEQPLVAVGWTLNFEIYFYVVFATALWFSRRFAPLIVSAIILAVFAVDRIVPGMFVTHYYSHMYIHFFLCGIALFYVWRLTSGRLPKLPAAIICASVLIFSYAIQIDMPSPGNWTFTLPVMIVGSMLLMAGAGVDLNWRPLTLLGDASYALYLTHMLLMGAIHRVAPNVLELGKSEAVWFVGLLLLYVAVGLIAYLAIEKPMLRSIRSLMASRGLGRGRAIARLWQIDSPRNSLRQAQQPAADHTVRTI